jgi:hypothetical protein
MAINTLEELLQNQNPFSEYTVRTQDIWEKDFLDEPSLNSHASDAVFQCIEKLQNHQMNVMGITLRAEKGVGKSHVISRIRHQLQESGTALFVYMGNYGNLNDIRSEFLKNLATSLKQIGSNDVTQWQELAAALLNDVFQKDYHPRDFVHGLPKKIKTDPQYVTYLAEKICATKGDISNPSIIQAILWTLSPIHASYAINWLAGSNLPQSKSDQLDLPNSNQEDRSFESFDTTCTVLSLISQYKSVVICFDQLESVEINEAGFTKAQVAASFGMDLYNNIQRGVLLTAVYTEIWQHQIKTLPSAEAVVDRIGQSIIDLNFLNAEGVVSLVKHRLTSFYSKHQITPPHELYPFDEEVLREKGKQKASARDILQWCQKNWKLDEIIVPQELVKTAYENELKSVDLVEFIEDKNRLSNALCFGLQSLIGKTIKGVTIDSIDYYGSQKNANKNHIDFRVLCTENSQPVKIGVAVIQYPVGRGIQAALSRLTNYEKFDLTRGCLIRSKDIPPKANMARQLLDRLLNELGGEWPPIKIADLKPLIAIRSVFDSREDYDLTEEMIREFIETKGLAKENELLLDILSAPSGQVPQDLVNEDVEFPTDELARTADSGLDIDSSDSDSLDLGDAA